jgi:hypothetical protein
LAEGAGEAVSLADYQKSVAALLFSGDPEPHVRALSTDALSEKRWRVYRRMVRQRLRECVDDTFPRTRALVGDEKWRPIVDRFFDAAPPTTPYLRAVPGELAAFLPNAIETMATDAPAWTIDLARHEWALLEVAVFGDERGADETEEVIDLRMDRPVVLAPAHRLLRSKWSVHRVPDPEGESIDTSSVVAGDFAVCLYRDPETHRVRALELTPVAAAILEEIERGEADRRDRTLVDALRAAADRCRVTIDEHFVQSFADVAEDWIQRGLWLGSRRV